jgi:hypothetical protein
MSFLGCEMQFCVIENKGFVLYNMIDKIYIGDAYDKNSCL